MNGRNLTSLIVDDTSNFNSKVVKEALTKLGKYQTAVDRIDRLVVRDKNDFIESLGIALSNNTPDDVFLHKGVTVTESAHMIAKHVAYYAGDKLVKIGKY
jgi:hypothetical protein